MTLQEKNNLLINNDFKGRVRIAALNAARDLMNDPQVTDRLVKKYCSRIRNNIFGEWINGYMFHVVEHEQTTPTVEDSLLQNIVNSVFTASAEQYYFNI